MWQSIGHCGSVNQACSCHTHHAHADFTFLFLAPHWCGHDRPRDKWAQTWKTLRLAKNNMLSMDLLSRNANTKCSLCCNYIHFDMNSRGDHFLYSSVNACFGGSMRFRDILWLQEAVLTLGWKSTKKWSMSRVKCGDVEGFLMHSMLDIKSMNESLKFKPSSMRNAPDPSPV